jgi:hypothetical protein
MGDIGKPERIIEIMPLEEPAAVPGTRDPDDVPKEPEPVAVPRG